MADKHPVSLPRSEATVALKAYIDQRQKEIVELLVDEGVNDRVPSMSAGQRGRYAEIQDLLEHFEFPK